MRRICSVLGGIRGALLAGLALAALCWPLERSWQDEPRRYPRVTPARIANALSDFSQLHGTGWRLLHEERGGGAWRYAARYDCGPRCSATAHVAHTQPAPHTHHLLLQTTECTPFSLCDEWWVEAEVSALEGGGALMKARGGRRCSALRALRGGCGVRGGELRRLADQLHHDSTKL